MTTVIREATIKLKVEQEAFQFEIPTLAPAIEEISKLNEQMTEFQTIAQESTGGVSVNIDHLGDTIINTTIEVEDANARMVEANLRAAESFKLAGEGAFTVARGVAFLSASSEEDMQRMLQNIAAVQGGFDLFRGSIDVVKGLREAQIALAAAQTATTAGMGAQAVAAGGLATALGPVGIGVGAVLAAGVTAWALWGDAAEDASERSERALDLSKRAIDDQIRELDRFARLQDKLAGFEDTPGQINRIDAELASIGEVETPQQVAARVRKQLAQQLAETERLRGSGLREFDAAAAAEGFDSRADFGAALREREASQRFAVDNPGKAIAAALEQEQAEAERIGDLTRRRAELSRREQQERANEALRERQEAERNADLARRQQEQAEAALGRGGRPATPFDQLQAGRRAEQVANEQSTAAEQRYSETLEAINQANGQTIGLLERLSDSQKVLADRQIEIERRLQDSSLQ